ncbi:hypothetical protein [Butyricimonas sp. Marseille-P3923]|uniref:hypothetical protein n=1 Tax=Butyricimonas sp. Marseille-P3923 TaxID=1987504 RepID=UPI000C07C1CC|nr:hypothetical protein [Butyricimonas sp. Marseille-P3923]
MAKLIYLLKGVALIMLLGSCTKWNYHEGELANGVHDCSMWEYLHTQPWDWDSTIIMIEHAGLKDLFEGKGEHEQITFLGVTNYSIRLYMIENGYEKVTDIPVEFCQNTLSKLIIPQRVMLADVPRGKRDEYTGEESDGIEYRTLGGRLFMWTYQQPFEGVPDMGEISLHFFARGGTAVNRIYSTDIQTNNGVVQALGYSFQFKYI